ncbi:DUF4157 domain-containing protein [Microseira sp. BLCC-F43]|uniref:eCIS core domain-containing protein n=1 Tax=Microseira sp. BLCC-F43 TaxID=3153602 RepID=UPI0035BB9946
MSERVPAQNKNSATPSQATQSSSPLFQQRPFTDERYESVGSNSNISKELEGIQPKTIRRSLNWQNITVEAPSRSDRMSLPGGIQRQQAQPAPAIGHQVSADSEEKSAEEVSNSTISTDSEPQQPKIARARLDWRNISVEAPSRTGGEASPQPIQRQQEEAPEIQSQETGSLEEKSTEKLSNSTISTDSEAQQPKIARAGFNWRNISIEAPPSAAASSTYPGGIQRQETSDVKEQEDSTESLQMQSEGAIQAKCSECEPQEKEEQNNSSIQTKLTVGAPGDKYEQEADNMAAKVMTMPDSAIQQPIQRQTEEEKEPVQMQPEANSITPLVQRQTGEEEAGYEADTEPPENYQHRREDAGVGNKVDFLTHRNFRTERRYRRQLKDQGGGRNVYVVSYRLPDGKRVRILTVSQPPGSLPSGHEQMDESTLASTTKVGHSEAAHHRIEQNSPELLDATRRYEATTREQCGSGSGNASCRYLYPSKAEEHFYGYPYSAPEDHIHNNELSNKVINNRNNNQRQTEGLSKDEKKQYQKAEKDAKWARQDGPDQNKALNKDLKNLGETDSSDEYSSDEDPVYLHPTARKLLGSDVKQLGKAPLFDIPAGKTLSEKEMADQKDWVNKQKEKQNNKRKNPETLEQDTNKKQRTEGSAPVQMKPGLQQAANGSSQASPSIENRLSNSKGGGSPLPDEVRSFMEPRFGADFSGVRVHTDSTAVQMNKELGAQAFAHGSDIYYGAGKSPGKNELTAHELTHTIQQGAAVRMNKQVRRQPNQQEEEKEQLQAKELPDRTLKDSLNKELRLQQQQEQEETEPLQAKEIPAQTPEVSLNRELGLQQQQKEEEGEPLQAKEIPAQTPEVSSNKQLRLQPLEEQEETEPLQAKELPGHNLEVSFNKELRRQPEETDDGVIQAKTLEGGITPSPLSIQRGIGDWVSKGWNKGKEIVGAGLGKGRDLLAGGLDWVKNNIIQPLMRLASSGWSAVKGFGSQIGNAFKQANPTIWDVFQPAHLLFRVARNQRRQLFAQAIQAERSQQAKAAAGVQSSAPAPVREPSQLERLNELAEKVESVPAAGFNVGKELLEGAVVGDFKENPTIWNTIGQVAIGFVPYAGQVADIRDIIANVKKLHETGYKDPDAWINLVLTGIGIIPGVGDAIKAVGKGSKGAIRKALSGVLKNADNILRPALGKAKGLLNGARRYGKQFLGWASGQGARLRQGVTQFAQKTVNFARTAGQRARGLVTALQARIGGFVNGAMQRARNVANLAQGLLGKVMGPFMGMARKAFDAVQSRVSQAVDMVKTAAQRGKDIALKVGRKVVDVTRKATTLLKEFTQSAIQKGREAVQKARQWSSQQINRVTQLGRRLVTQARKRVTDLVRKGIKLAKEKALTWIKQKIAGVKQRVLGFLKDRWNRLKEKLGIKKPGQAGKEGAERGGKEAINKAAEMPRALAEAAAIAKSLEATGTAIPGILSGLMPLKTRYRWIKAFEAEPKSGDTFTLFLIASKHKIISVRQRRRQYKIDAQNIDRAGGHSYADHGAHTTPEQHRQRLLTGVTPGGSTRGIPSESSKFATHRAHVDASQKAQVELANNCYKTNGTLKKEVTVVFDMPGSGFSYTIDSAGNLLPPKKVDKVYAFFRQNSHGWYDLITMYPKP